jgi:hypothetical protein
MSLLLPHFTSELRLTYIHMYECIPAIQREERVREMAGGHSLHVSLGEGEGELEPNKTTAKKRGPLPLRHFLLGLHECGLPLVSF